jgi:hypothetical protein
MGNIWRAAAAVSMGALLTACASLGGGGAGSWKEVTHVEDRFAVYVDQALPRDGDTVTFRLMYIYGDGKVQWEGKDVGWQEYSAMTVNCTNNQVKLGPRARHAPNGDLLFEDNEQSWVDINPGTAVDNAAKARCEGVWPEEANILKDRDGWMTEAREHIAQGPPAAET